MTGFRIINKGCGFQITFANGYAISVTFGPGSNSANKSARYVPQSPLDLAVTCAALGEQGSPDAEISIYDRTGELMREHTSPWQSPDDFMDIAKFVQGIEEASQ